MVEPNTATDIAIERVSMFFYINVHFLSFNFFSFWEETGMDEHAFEILPFVILPYIQGVVKYISDTSYINNINTDFLFLALHKELFLWSICNRSQVYPPERCRLARETDGSVECDKAMFFDL